MRNKIEAALAHEQQLLASAIYRNVRRDEVSCIHTIRVLEALLAPDGGPEESDAASDGRAW